MFQRNHHPQDVNTKEHTTPVHEFYMFSVKTFLTLHVKFMYWYCVFLCIDILRMAISLKHAGGLCSWITCNFMCICWYVCMTASSIHQVSRLTCFVLLMKSGYPMVHLLRKHILCTMKALIFLVFSPTCKQAK
jgi:hypothetical protein